MDALTCLRTLRAVRQFRDEPIPDDVLTNILEAARWSGSAKNTQPWQFVVIRDRATLAELSKLGQFAGHLAGAALGIVILTQGGPLDTGRVAQNMMLAAHAQGVGSCIASILPADNQRQALDLLRVPSEFQLGTTISFGYPAPVDRPTIEGQPPERVLSSMGRKPLTDIVHYDAF
jgi:nitroreductase